MIRQKIKNLIEKAIKELQKERAEFFPNFEIPEINIGSPPFDVFGDYSSDIAIQIAVKIKKSALTDRTKIANKIIKKIKNYDGRVNLFWDVRPEGKSVLINFYLSENYLRKELKKILRQKENFGNLKVGKDKKVNVEFISANPTGPLTLGNGRGGFCGDVLTNILNKAGFKAKREYYINDAGEQVRKLGHSVLDDTEAVYKGAYIENLKKRR